MPAGIEAQEKRQHDRKWKPVCKYRKRHSGAAGRNRKEKENEELWTKTMEIKGMMCGHCEARVKKALEALPEVTEAIVSHEAGTAVVKLSAAVSDDALKKAVEDQDYEVTDIR